MSLTFVLPYNLFQRWGSSHQMDWSSLCLFAEYRSKTLFFCGGEKPFGQNVGPNGRFYSFPGVLWMEPAGKDSETNGLVDITNSFYPNPASFSPSSFELAMLSWVFLSFFSFFFSFYYGVTIINPTIKIPFEQENKPILRTSMYFLGSTPEWG